jgi:hypothetical protein
VIAAERVKPLLAGSRLSVLEEFRVPFEDGAPAGGEWAQLSAGEPRRALSWWTGTTGPPVSFVIEGGRLYGRLAPAAAVVAYSARLGGEWNAELPVLGPDGEQVTCILRSPDGGTILPFDPDEVVRLVRSEAYRLEDGIARSATSSARRAYYALRPVMPRPLQIALRRRYAGVQRRSDFPRWPAETALHDLVDRVLGWAADAAGEPLPYLAPWPDEHAWALVLTHDVEKAAGRDAIDRVRAVEAAAGVRSSWNLVPERYDVSDALVARLHAAGCEVGVHGLRHDGRDLESLPTLQRRLPRMRAWAERWGAVGFRAPATHRVWEWMPQLGFDYDSSYPDTDPYEPMAGGCCTWLPFFNDDLVELPITLVQDHTAFVILRRDEQLWHEKTDLLRARGGMALLITHPDYLTGDAELAAYRRFLETHRDDPGVWHALPSEVAAWWRQRAATSLVPAAGGWSSVGPAAARALVRYRRPGPAERAPSA